MRLCAPNVFLQIKGIAAVSRKFPLYANVWLMARRPLARKLRDNGNWLKRRGEHSLKAGDFLPTRKKISRADLKCAGSAYSRANHLRCWHETTIMRRWPE